jgi:hypothetical protein
MNALGRVEELELNARDVLAEAVLRGIAARSRENDSTETKPFSMRTANRF